MEVLTDSYNFLNELVFALEDGQSSYNFVESYVEVNTNAWTQKLSQFIFKYKSNSVTNDDFQSIVNPYEKAILQLLIKSFEGDPVSEELKKIENQYFLAHQKNLDQHILKLPYLNMLPLFIFLFPAYLTLLLGPIFRELLRSLQ